MADLVITGASRGIGRALALELAARGKRLVLTARDGERLAAVVAAIAAQGGRALAVPGDLASVRGARELAARLGEVVAPGATLVHNAGLWPARRVLNEDGLETAFVVNHLAGVALVGDLLAAERLARVMVVSAGLIVLGRFDAERTPTGADFSRLRTYATTKLCFALAARDLAAAHSEVDFVVLHPGVVRTDLGTRPGLLGALLGLAKRVLESPESCARRLARLLARDRWSPPGDPRWLVAEQERPWPEVAIDARTRDAVRRVTERYLTPGLAATRRPV
jgi:NAD(P)-dependent dehydrogenase (short-subunit alcohol dehydrogenase family)